MKLASKQERNRKTTGRRKHKKKNKTKNRTDDLLTLLLDIKSTSDV